MSAALRMAKEFRVKFLAGDFKAGYVLVCTAVLFEVPTVLDLSIAFNAYKVPIQLPYRAKKWLYMETIALKSIPISVISYVFSARTNHRKHSPYRVT
jgi:hypothetical protein